MSTSALIISRLNVIQRAAIHVDGLKVLLETKPNTLRNLLIFLWINKSRDYNYVIHDSANNANYYESCAMTIDFHFYQLWEFNMDTFVLKSWISSQVL